MVQVQRVERAGFQLLLKLPHFARIVRLAITPLRGYSGKRNSTCARTPHETRAACDTRTSHEEFSNREKSGRTASVFRRDTGALAPCFGAPGPGYGIFSVGGLRCRQCAARPCPAAGRCVVSRAVAGVALGCGPAVNAGRPLARRTRRRVRVEHAWSRPMVITTSIGSTAPFASRQSITSRSSLARRLTLHLPGSLRRILKPCASTPTGRRAEHGARRQFNYASPEYRVYCAAIVGATGAPLRPRSRRNRLANRQ